MWGESVLGQISLKFDPETGIAVTTLGGELARSKVAASIVEFADFLDQTELQALVIDASGVDLPDETGLSLEMWRDGLDMLPGSQRIAYVAPPRFRETREVAVRLAAGRAAHTLEVFETLEAALEWAHCADLRG